jgi:hypothetical protein
MWDTCMLLGDIHLDNCGGAGKGQKGMWSLHIYHMVRLDAVQTPREFPRQKKGEGQGL